MIRSPGHTNKASEKIDLFLNHISTLIYINGKMSLVNFDKLNISMGKCHLFVMIRSISNYINAVKRDLYC